MAAAGGQAAAAPALPPGSGGYTLAEVAKHNSKTDCWVVLDGKVLDVTSFLSEHPGGELAILTFAGKDATEEFNMIHPPDVVGKYAPDAIIGVVGTGGGGGGGGGSAPAPASGGAAQPLLDKSGHKVRDYKVKTQNTNKRMQGEGKIPGWFGALLYMALGFMKE